MTIRKENIVKETEKALQIIIGLRQCDNGKYMIVRGNGGYFKEVMAWVPKSQINTENEIPQWLATKILREAHLNITDEIFNQKRLKMKVVITNMHTKEKQIKEHLSDHEAVQYYLEWCDEHDYPYNEESKESGGIGFDYRIEIVED